MTNRHLPRRITTILVAALLITPLGFWTTSSPAAAAGFTYVVNSNGDEPDLADDGQCLTSVGTCTLRAALEEYKYRSNTTVDINFNIPGDGPHTIQLGSQLPIINKLTVPVTINGYTQPGAQPNTDLYGSNAVMKIHIRGTGESTSNFTPIFVTSPNNAIRGLAITRGFKKIKVLGPDAYGNQFSGLWLGTDPSATYRATNRVTYSNGIELVTGAHHNIVGGPNLADRNVVSGNAGHGISLYDDGTSFNRVINNIVGMNPMGTDDMPNLVEGIDLNQNVNNNYIGGWGPHENNVVSGNSTGGIESSHLQPNLGNRFNEFVNNWVGTTLDGNSRNNDTDNGNHGMVIQDGSRYNLIEGNIVGGNPVGIRLDPFGPGHEVIGNVFRNNKVGVARNGSSIPNSSHGIQLEDLSIDNVFEGNEIANNGGRGIVMNTSWGSAVGNTFTRNSIYNNGQSPGIDLPPLGQVNNNDAGDTDTGANSLLNQPVITSANTTLVSGTACANCRIEVFDAGAGASSNGNGPGRTFLADAMSNGSGNWTVVITGKLPVGGIVTTTATDEVGSTSEYSRNAQLTSAPNYGPTANATVQCTALTCSFDGTGSTDIDGTIVSYNWQFSDGGNASGAQVQHVFANDNEASATLTVTDDDGAPAQTVITVPVAPVFEIPVAADAFGRSVASGWGTADLGGAYGYAAGQQSSFSVNGTSGATTLPSAGLQRQAFLSTVNEAEAEVSVVATPQTAATNGFGITSSIQLRRVANNNEYRARVRYLPNGTVRLAVTRADGGSSETILGSEVLVPGLTWSPGTSIAIQAQIWNSSPTTIRVKVWNAAGAEPTTWPVRVTDATPALQGPGNVGLRTQSGADSTAGAATVLYDNLSVFRKGTPPPNQPPVADAGASCFGLDCSFDGSASADADGNIVEYTWNFGDGTTIVNGATTSHTFAAYGDYNAVLTVVDDDGAVDTFPIALSVVPPPNTPPEPETDVSCLGLECTFDGSASYDPDGTVVDHVWHFGDGSDPVSGAVVQHTFAAYGDYSATLTVIDDDGDSTIVDIPVSVTPIPNQPPVPVANISCDAQACEFDGTASTDGDGTITTYTWDFGDGTDPVSGSVVEHTFAAFGTYTVTLTVIDNEGTPGSVPTELQVTPVFELPLANDSFGRSVASGWGTADLGGTYGYPAGHAPSFSVNGSAGVSTVPSAGATRQVYLNSISEQDLAAGVVIAPQTAPSGGFGFTSTVMLRRVANNTEYRARVRFAPDGTVYLAPTRATGNSTETLLAPEVALPGTWSAGEQIALAVQIWGTNPTTIRMKAWDTAGTEPTEWAVTATDATPALQAAGGVGVRTYVGSGSSLVPVAVRYDDLVFLAEGAIPPNQAPTASIGFSCFGLECSFDGSGSSDPDGSIVDYSWDFGDGSPVVSGEGVNHTFPGVGEYPVQLTVIDDDGAPASVTIPVEVEPPGNLPPTALADIDCTGLMCTFDGSGSSDPDGSIVDYSWDFGDGSPVVSGEDVNHTFPAPGDYNVMLTVTDNGSLTGFTVVPVTVTPAFDVTVASDAFGRVVASGWGTADQGGTWGYAPGHNTAFSVDGSAGVVTVPSSGVQRQAFLAGISENALDVTLTASPQQAAAGTFGFTSSVQLRRLANNTEYRARVRFAPNGTVHLAITRATGGSTETVIGTEVPVSGVTWSPGSTVALRAQIWGTNPTTVRARVWNPAGSEPSTWAVTTTDSTALLQAAGGVGVHTYVGNSASAVPVQVRYDGLVVSRPS